MVIYRGEKKMELKINYVTPIPAKRISENGEIDLRIASKNCTKINVSAFKNDTLICDFGYFSVDKQLKVNSIKIKTKGIFGKIDLVIYFLNNDNKVEETVKLPYEIIKSIVHGTQLLDGCWISLYHWSDDEARYFNHALKNLDSEGFKQQIFSMHNIGITGVIIQNVFDSPYYVGTNDKTIDTYDGKAFYNSELYSGRVDIRCEDPIEAILTAADECDMAVFPGVGLFAWFDFSPESLEWHKKVTLELHNKYGHHKSFQGWYLSQEISRRTKNMSKIYAEVGKHAKSVSGNLTTLVSPYIHGVKTDQVMAGDKALSVKEHEEEWDEILDNVKGAVDIMAFQDGQVDYHELYDYLVINKKLADKYNMKCWTNIESFDRDMPIRFLPIKWEKLLLKLDAARRAGMENAITFEFSHFMSPNSAYLQAGHLYERYCEHFIL